MISKETLEAVRIGILDDGQLAEAVHHYSELEKNLRCHGELFQLTWENCYRTLLTLKDFEKNRKDKIGLRSDKLKGMIGLRNIQNPKEGQIAIAVIDGSDTKLEVTRIPEKASLEYPWKKVVVLYLNKEFDIRESDWEMALENFAKKVDFKIFENTAELIK